MRLKRSNLGARVCVLASFVVLSATAVTAAPALALPEDRVYEMVSPVYKGGYDAGLEAIAPDGESVLFTSKGVFGPGLQWSIESSAYYLASRGPAGWSTTSVAAPPVTSFLDVSSTLQYVLASGSLEASQEGTPTSGTESMLHRTSVPDTAASWELAGGIVLKAVNGEQGQKGLYDSASADLCHIVLNKAEVPMLPEAEFDPHAPLYDLAAAPAGGCRGDGSRPLRIVSVKNTLGPHGEPEPMSSHCGAEPGLGLKYQGITGKVQTSSWNPVAAGGEEIFFTTGVVKGDCVSVHQLFVRLGGERTLEVSKPVSEAAACGVEVPCAGAVTRASANFVGASEDGSRVFFQTTAALSPEDKDVGNDLYMAMIGCPEGEPGCATAQKQIVSLVQVSHGGEAANVQEVVRVASDGSRVYFVATGVLSEGVNAKRRAPVKGAANLYVYDAHTGKLTFVTDGGVEEAQSNPDGRFLVFSSYSQLLKNDTDTAKDVYRYDAETGILDRVSVGEAGFDANGNNNAFDATIPHGGISAGGTGGGVRYEHEMGSRAVSEDGSRIVFSTAEPLSPGAVNGLVNVYEWHEQPGQVQGEVSMVSSGTSTSNDSEAVISESGQDVFFTTGAQLVAQDTDENLDVYDARLAHVPGEQLGFSVRAAEPQPCSGDACQGPLTNPAPLLVPGSVSQAPGGNFAAPSTTPTTPKKCPKARKLSHGRCVKTKARKARKNRRAKR
jgi:hypothetical protein